MKAVPRISFAFLLGLALAWGLCLFLSAPAEAADPKVPNVVGQGEAQARKALEQAGFRVEISAQPTSIQNQQGIVVKQNPPGGSQVPLGSVVKLASGRYQPPPPAQVEVPRLNDRPGDQARQEMERLGFKVQIVQNTPTDRQDRVGQVASQSHLGKLLLGSNLILYTYKYEATQVPVPNVVGMKMDQARQVLTQAGLQVQGKFEPSDRQEEDNKVIGISNPINAQSLAAGQKVPKNSVVHLTILQYRPSQKPAQPGVETKPPVQQPQTQAGQGTPMRTMPNVVGLPFSEAAGKIIGLGLFVKIPPEQVESTDSKQDDKVAQQNPAVGQPFPANKNVLLKVYKYSNKLPDVMGLPLEEAKRKLEAIGLEVSLNPPYKTGDKSQDGKVAHQYPPGGGLFPNSRKVALARYQYDAGTTQTIVPKVVDLRLDEAISLLTKAGLNLMVSERAGTKDQSRADRIFNQTPAPGSSVAKGTTIFLSQYLYSPLDQVTAPNVVGLTVEKALQVIRSSGLVNKPYVMKPIDSTELLPSYHAKNKVSSQDPAAGAKVTPITPVRLKTIYEGVVPNVVGMDITDAHWVLGSCGISYYTIFEKAPISIQPPPRKGIIFFQDPRPGEPLPKQGSAFVKVQWPD